LPTKPSPKLRSWDQALGSDMLNGLPWDLLTPDSRNRAVGNLQIEEFLSVTEDARFRGQRSERKRRGPMARR
jgi:hypothetical protein